MIPRTPSSAWISAMRAVPRMVRHAITHVLHLAAESMWTVPSTDPADFIHTNIVGTFHLLEACREAWLGGP